mmetsp:Transcript_18973/g.43063  ORF Transcript_18973/g.43063 Transcript_18973/m.43063 type:complete len:544 (-) Transcript_18973:226-1857(-)
MAPLRILLAAPPGTGKTTLCERVHGKLAALARSSLEGIRIEGFLCHRRNEESGSQTGFDMEMLDCLQRAPPEGTGGSPACHTIGHDGLEVFEALALPVLERAAAGKAEPRLVVFDEAGGLEAKSCRFQAAVRQLLASPDDTLHLLGVVSQDSGIVSESSSTPRVEVMPVSEVNRDRCCEPLFWRYATALGFSLESEGEAPRQARTDVQDLSFAEADPSGFTPIFPENPSENFASLNAGDYLLYVGGAAINKAFALEMRSAGQNPKDRFELLHEALLAVAARSPGSLSWLRPGDLFSKSDAASPARQSKCHYCGQQAECWEAPWRSWKGKLHCSSCWDYYARWFFEDVSAFCGVVPAGGGGGPPGDLMAALRPVGLVSVAAFPACKRPRSKRNVAMVYAVGPNCGSVRKKTRREVDKLSAPAFLSVVASVGHAVATAVTGFNRERPSEEVPRIDVLRVCLLSGGVYKHPDATKQEVAGAMLRGLLGGHDGGAHSPRFDFAFDEDAFQKAWGGMQQDRAMLRQVWVKQSSLRDIEGPPVALGLPA